MFFQTRCLVNISVPFKNTRHVWKGIVFAMSLYLASTVHGTVHTVCSKTDTYTAIVPMNCSSDQMIHVISKLYGRRTSEDNCAVVNADSNIGLYDSSNNGLIVQCNGYKQCTEQAACGTKCNGSGNAFEITYECVEDSKDVCTVYNQTGPLPSLYLHSPMFPASQDEVRSCVCSVSGQSLDVLIIQQRGWQGVLQINTTGADNNTWESNFNQFNTKIASDARHVVVIYTDHTFHTFWLRIAGKITHISCSNSLTTPKTTATTNATETTQTIEATEITGSTESIKTTEAIEATEDTGVTESIGSVKATEAIKRTETKETSEVTAIMTEAIEITTLTESETSAESSISHALSEGRSTEEENTTVITVSAVCGVIIFLLLVIIGLLLVYFKVIKPKRRKQNNTGDRVSNIETEIDNISGSNEPRNTYSDLVRYANQDNDYGKLHIYANR